MILELANDPRRSFETTERRIYIALRPKHCEKMLAKRPSDLEVKESIWQGNIVSNRLDETVELSECFNWSNLHNLLTERNISANP